MKFQLIFVKSLLLTVFFVFVRVCVFAQAENYGTRLSAGVEKKLDHLTLSAEGELRTMYYVRLISRGSLQLTADYQVAKPLSFGAGYEFMNFLDTKYKDYQLRHRLFFYAGGKCKWNRFTISLREKIQFTTKDESDRIKPNGKTDTYAINPEWLSRTRLKISYDINNSPLTPFLAFEAGYQLNNPEGNKVENIKVMLGTNFKLNKKHSFEFYVLGNKDVNVNADEEQSRFAFGVAYTFKPEKQKK